MAKEILKELQNKTDETLVRNANLLDILTKITDASSRANRAVIRSITSCGCISVATQKNELPKDADYTMLKQYKVEHLTGSLCPICKEKVEEELGRLHYYIAALCGTLNLSNKEIIEKEIDRLETLGKYLLR